MTAPKPTRSPKRSLNQSPRVLVNLQHESIKKTRTLPKPLDEVLSAYSIFLSEHHGTKVTEDQVLESLLLELQRDKLFAQWRQNTSKQAQKGDASHA